MQKLETAGRGGGADSQLPGKTTPTCQPQPFPVALGEARGGAEGPPTTTQDRLGPQLLGHQAHAVLPSAPNLVGVTAWLPLACAHMALTHQEAQGASPQGTLRGCGWHW